MLRNLIIICISCIFISCNLWQWSQAELYTAISDIERLIDTHQRIILYLDDYLQNEEKRLSVLRQHLNIFKTEQGEAMKDIPAYIGNPINAFTIIKRLTKDLDEIEQRIKISINYTGNLSIIHEDMLYPTFEDLTGAALALTRLQKTYKLSTTDLSDGILNGLQYWSPEINLDAAPMSSSDCYELGKALYFAEDFKYTIPWMKEAFRKYRENPDEVYTYTEVDVLEYISFSYYLLNDFRSALRWAAKVLAIEPKHNRVEGNVPHFQNLLREQEEKKKKNLRVDKMGTQDGNEFVIAEQKMQYARLCRAEMVLPNVLTNKLSCRYLTAGHPFLRLAPIKMEQYYVTPDIFLFHDVMSDDEIEAIKKSAKPKFRRAVVQNKSGGLIPASYRISKSAWLTDENIVVARISQRIQDFTGLSMKSSEELQIVNYGIGGQYEPHYDFAREDEVGFSGYSGNRIATVLFYMSNVAQGGATVFPHLGLTVFPIKNAALFWYNLHPSGKGDLATKHAACPVLRGSKWVSTKWIHEGGQELIRLCGLEYQEEGYIRKLPLAVPKSSREILIT